VLALRLFLSAAQAANTCGFEAISYEFVAQAFITYEDEIPDSKSRYSSILYMAAALQQMTGFTEENYDTLISKCVQHAAKLLQKVDQCRAVYNCSHLFWSGSAEEGYRDEKKVLACLKKSLKIANSCMGHQVPMFVEILNKYLFFYDRECPSITAKYLKGLIDLIDEHMENLGETSSEAKRHYENTLEHIRQKQMGEGGERYGAIFGQSPAEEETLPAATAPPATEETNA
jgi:vacuolar protein sorting-associated protein 35